MSNIQTDTIYALSQSTLMLVRGDFYGRWAYASAGTRVRCFRYHGNTYWVETLDRSKEAAVNGHFLESVSPLELLADAAD